ncbi:hypothetical protein DXG03_007533, partial [Asterophora parasitica]
MVYLRTGHPNGDAKRIIAAPASLTRMPQGALPLHRDHHNVTNLALATPASPDANHQNFFIEAVVTAAAPTTVPPQTLDKPGVMPQSASLTDPPPDADTPSDRDHPSPMGVTITELIRRK